jgi:hypothetical protein
VPQVDYDGKKTWWPPSPHIVPKKKKLNGCQVPFLLKTQKKTWWPPGVHPLEYEEENDLVATKFPYTPRRRKRTW